VDPRLAYTLQTYHGVEQRGYLKGLLYEGLILATVNNHELLSPPKGHVYEMYLRK